MLYNKLNDPIKNNNIFTNPPIEYRGIPFWAWNGVLKKDVLDKQIEYFKQMGFGGFIIHSRPGLSTKYLGSDFMNNVLNCVKKAEDEKLFTWLYDEDRWPSGSAGGYLTKEAKNKQKMLLFTTRENSDNTPIAVFDIVLNENGELLSCSEPKNEIKGTVWYVYAVCAKREPWYNGETYADLMSPDTVEEFINITYEKYNDILCGKLGKSIPAMFTDEPQIYKKESLAFAQDTNDVSLPFTPDFFESFEKAYGYDLKPKLPELIWELPKNHVSQARYHYHDHICERFSQAYFSKCSKWCEEHNILFTGHLQDEDKLYSQTCVMGEAMRLYRYFTLPGIDLICDKIELTTAKQAQSAVHQYGREGMLCELYGVTDWNFDFRGHKFQGDWLAALGVTMRVPHLAWLSMKGCSKRDYPASIGYQSPWYNKYNYIEDYYARLNTALTRGKADVEVAVIHPIESCWLYMGPQSSTANTIKELDENFKNITEWLLFGLIDFDFISESLLPDQCTEISDSLTVGYMKYKAIIVPDCRTLRFSTIEILKKFSLSGGKVIFMGDCPKYVDAKESDKAHNLYEIGVKTSFTKHSVLNALSQYRKIDIKNEDGTSTDNLIYNLRSDKERKWLFIAHAKRELYMVGYSFPTQKIRIEIKGEYKPTLCDALSGKFVSIAYKIKNGITYIDYTLYQHDSILLLLENQPESVCEKSISENKHIIKKIDFKEKVAYSLSEENVLLLDECEYSLDGGDFHPTEEIMKADTEIRKILSYPPADGKQAQPWTAKPEKPSHFVTLKYSFESETEVECFLAVEEAEKIYFNDEEVDVKYCDYYVDFDIHKIKMPNIKKGTNTLFITMPISAQLSLESTYLLGDFDVELFGTQKIIKPKADRISFGSITNQGMPFYGGNITYKTNIETPKCSLEIQIPNYKGALTEVLIDGKNAGIICFEPYTLTLQSISKGVHSLEFILYGNRFNTFGALHSTDPTIRRGPNMWYPEDKYRCYEYQTDEFGIITSPIITIFEKRS